MHRQIHPELSKAHTPHAAPASYTASICRENETSGNMHPFVDDHFLYYYADCAHEQKAHGSAVNNKKAVSAMLVAHTKINNSKYSGVFDNLGRFVMLMSCLDA